MSEPEHVENFQCEAGVPLADSAEGQHFASPTQVSMTQVQGEEVQEGEKSSEVMCDVSETEGNDCQQMETEVVPADGTLCSKESQECEGHDHNHHHGHEDVGDFPLVTPGDVVELDEAMEDLYIMGTVDGFQKVTKIDGLQRMDNLTELTLQSCLIRKMEGLEGLTSLTRLTLYDNQILSLNVPPSLNRLTYLDMSYNLVKSMAALAACPLLEEVFVAQNRVRAIEGLEGLTRLRKLDLGANRIRSMAGLEGCTSLEELWLGKNKITQIGGISTLTRLRRLDVQSNRLTSIDGLEGLNALAELYLSHNLIESAIGLESQINLDTLDLSRNKIADFEGLQHLVQLTDLWMGGNLISSYEVVDLLQPLSSLTCLYLEHNPIYKDFEYRKRLALMLPTLTQIDATRVAR